MSQQYPLFHKLQHMKKDLSILLCASYAYPQMYVQGKNRSVNGPHRCGLTHPHLLDDVSLAFRKKKKR